MLSIDLLVSTMNYTQGALDKLISTVPAYVNIIVVNQVTEAFDLEPLFKIKPNVTCHSFSEKGLSKSRNHLIGLAKNEVLVITDDDIEFLPDAFERISKAFIENQEQDILTFQMLKPTGEFRKQYKSAAFQHNIFSIAKVSSCEIAARRSSLQSKKVKYDELFGLGSTYALGEEVIFLKDCLAVGLKIRYIPTAISCHPVESTGRLFSKVTELSRGALFFRLYGFYAYFLSFIFYLRKRQALKSSIGIISALNAYFLGIYEYQKHNK